MGNDTGQTLKCYLLKSTNCAINVDSYFGVAFCSYLPTSLLFVECKRSLRFQFFSLTKNEITELNLTSRIRFLKALPPKRTNPNQ